MPDPRQPYSTAGFCVRPIVGGTFDINVWNGTAFAVDEETALNLSREDMLKRWPPEQGWSQHTAFAYRIPDDVLDTWIHARS